MKVKFQKIEIHNFLSYQDESFSFEDTKGMNLITGKNYDIPGSRNGCGKSSWALALTYGLYGKFPYNLNNQHIPNRHIDDKDTRVCVYLTSNKRHFKICSGLHGRSSNCTLFEIVNGKEKDITLSTIAETRAYIEKEIVGCDIDIFMRTTFLNSDPEYNFHNLSDKNKREFIDKIFEVSIYRDMYNEIHGDNKRLEKDLVGHDNKLMVLNKNSEDYMAKSEEFKTSNDQNVKILEANLSEYENLLREKSDNMVERNTSLINEYTDKSTKLADTIANDRMNLQKIEFEIRSLKEKIATCKSKISEREKFISKHNSLKDKLCSDCKGIFTKHYNLETYTNDIEKLNAIIDKSNESIVKETENYRTLKAKRDVDELERNSMLRKIAELNADYEKSKREISELESTIRNSRFKLDTLKNSVNPYLALIENNNKAIEVEMEEISKIKEEYRYTSLLEELVNQDTLKKHIIKDLVGVLNVKVKHYLHRLGANYDVVFDENMDCTFQTGGNREAVFHNFSSGEQARISIATCFAFRDFLSIRNGLSSNILILDEFIDSNVDSMAIENIIEILKEFSRINGQHIYLVSHRQEVGQDNFKRIIQVEKRNNISSIKYLTT